MVRRLTWRYINMTAKERRQLSTGCTCGGMDLATCSEWCQYCIDKLKQLPTTKLRINRIGIDALGTIAGHSFDRGRCGCGRSKSDLGSVVNEFREKGKTPVGLHGIAHVSTLSENEWNEMCKMVDEENKAFDAALADICRT